MVAGVVTGPTVVSCIERGDFGQCISEAYFGAQPTAVADVAPAAEQPAAPVEPTQEPEVVEEVEVAEVAEPTEAAEEPVVATGPAPAFTLVRVEPDGSAVIAGSASPSSEIQVFANEELLGSEKAESTGDFVYVTESPLPSGGVELRLLDVATGEFATQSVVVIVQEDRTSEPLVVASEPGQASAILQGLETESVAEAEAEAEIAEEAVAVADVATSARTAEPAASVEVEEQALVEAEQSTEPAEQAVADTSAPVSETTSAVAAAEAVPAEEPAQAAEQLAAVQQPAQMDEPAPVIAIVPPTIDAVEIDGDHNFFAGGGTEGLSVRLYVENRPVGTAEVQDGRWLVEAENVLTAASQRIRVDMLNPDGTVASRAEVDFIVDLPELAPEPEQQPVAVAQAPAQETAAQPAPAVVQTPAAVEAPEQAEPAQTAATVPETPAEPATQPAEVAAVKPESESPVVEETAQPVPAPVPTLIGTTTGNRTTSGHVIIRRGDNLWTIARRVYGEGLRYTQIFEANANQIRNPDLIYPGQVFDLPGTDVVLGNEQ